MIESNREVLRGLSMGDVNETIRSIYHAPSLDDVSPLLPSHADQSGAALPEQVDLH